jgi:hypothetical protein
VSAFKAHRVRGARLERGCCASGAEAGELLQIEIDHHLARPAFVVASKRRPLRVRARLALSVKIRAAQVQTPAMPKNLSCAAPVTAPGVSLS